MSAEGMPPTEPSLLSRPLASLAQLVVRYPLLTLALGCRRRRLGLGRQPRSSEFHTNRDDVLNPSSSYNRRWQEYTKEFSDEEDVVVVVEGTTARRSCRCWTSWRP